MGTLPADELLDLWKLEKLPLEMAMGHVLQHLTRLSKTVQALDLKTYQLDESIDGLIKSKKNGSPPLTR